MRRFVAIWLLATGPFLMLAAANAQNAAEQLRAKFEQEANAVRKAKMMVRLGDTQFADIQKDLSGDRFSDALATLEQYRDEAAESSHALDALNVNAEKHSAGFRELQISLREFLRRLNEATVTLTSDKQEPILKIRRDLEETNQHLIHELFPARPASSPKGA